MDKKIKSKIILLLVFFFAALSFPLILYWIKFGNWNLSDSFSDWIGFSTYFNNSLMVVLSVINIIVIMYIAKIAQSFDTTKHLQNIELQEEYEKLRRLHEYKIKLIELLNKITENIVVTPNVNSLAVSQSNLDTFINLFSKELKFDKALYHNLINQIDKIGKNLNNIDDQSIVDYISYKDSFINNIISNVNK